MSWKPEADEIRRRRERARQHGGDEAVARHRERGRLPVRERIEALVDAGSFAELGGVAGRSDGDTFTPTNVVAGTARLGGRPCVVCGDDFTLRGAAYTVASMRKALHAEQLAVRNRTPLVRLLEAGGASIAGTGGEKGRSGYDFVSPSPLSLFAMEALAEVPVVCAALGPVAGFPAGRLVASHLSIMTRGAQVLVGGPALVERATGERVAKEELGGPEVHLRSGVVDNGAEDEADVWRQVRAFLGYLPASVHELPPRVECDDPPDRREDALLEAVPRERRRAYKMRRILEWVVDRGSFFEMGALHGRSQITGLARVAGRPVGVLANDPVHQGGSMTAGGARKVRRFAELCDAFSLPVISFVDEPGFAIGPEAERAGTIRFGMEALFAVSQTRVPWLAILVRRSFGVAAGIHLGRDCTAWAWPSAQSGSMPVEGGVALAYGREIAAAPDPEARRRELEEELAAAQSIWPRAEDFGVHDLIDPRETRPRIAEWLALQDARLAAARGPARYTPRP